MGRNLEAVIFTSLLASAAASPQLVNPPDLPATCDNVQLYAQRPASSGSLLGAEGWHVSSAGGDNDRVESLALARPGAGGTSAATSFYLDPATKALASRRTGDTTARELVVESGSSGPLLLSSERHRGQLHPLVEWKLGAPQLTAGDGQFYACEMPGDARLALYYRQTASQGLPDSCVDVTLLSKRAEGPVHGDASLVLCCEDVRDGQCV